MQLLNEVSLPYILNKKCIYTYPGQNNESTKRMILMEEPGKLKHPPPRPPIDCQVSQITHIGL